MKYLVKVATTLNFVVEAEHYGDAVRKGYEEYQGWLGYYAPSLHTGDNEPAIDGFRVERIKDQHQ